MTTLVSLAWRSLLNRRGSVLLTIFADWLCRSYFEVCSFNCYETNGLTLMFDSSSRCLTVGSLQLGSQCARNQLLVRVP